MEGRSDCHVYYKLNGYDIILEGQLESNSRQQVGQASQAGNVMCSRLELTASPVFDLQIIRTSRMHPDIPGRSNLPTKPLLR